MASFVGTFGSVSFKHIANHRFRLVFIFGRYYTRASVDKDDYLKLHMLCLARKGYKAPTICNLLKAENLSCTRKNVFLFLKRYAETHSMLESRAQEVFAEI